MRPSSHDVGALRPMSEHRLAHALCHKFFSRRCRSISQLNLCGSVHISLNYCTSSLSSLFGTFEADQRNRFVFAAPPEVLELLPRSYNPNGPDKIKYVAVLLSTARICFVQLERVLYRDSCSGSSPIRNDVGRCTAV